MLRTGYKCLGVNFTREYGMNLFGKTKFQKFANTIVLIVLIGYGFVKSGIISPEMSTGIEYTFPASELNISNKEELDQALQGYQVDPEKLSSILNQNQITLDEFEKSVTMELVADHSQDGFKGLVLEFNSSINSEKLKPAYDYMANDIKQKILSYTKKLTRSST